MILLPPCKTTHAALLCAVKDAKGVLRIPESNATPDCAGIVFTPEPLQPINPQLVAVAGTVLRADVALLLQVVQEFADPCGEDTTLYVASLASGAKVVASEDWASFPVILRRLTGRARIPYLRAWQVLAGGLQLNTKAIEAAELPKYLDD